MSRRTDSFCSALTMGAMREPSEPLTMTTSPAPHGGQHLRFERGRVLGIAAATARRKRAARARASAARSRTRDRSHWRRPAARRPRCNARPRGPSSSMSPSTAMRRPRAPTGRWPSSASAAAHRCGIGVVALVDERSPARRADRSRTRAPRPRSGLEVGERQRGEREIGADQHRRREHRQRIVHEMAPRRADLVGQLGAEDVAPGRPSSRDAARI